MTDLSQEWYSKRSEEAQACDHLIQNPKAYIIRLFAYLGISLAHVEAAAQSMNYDSQAGLTFSRDKQATVSTWCRDEAQVNRCNTVLTMLELPDLDSKYMMNDTFQIGINVY